MAEEQGMMLRNAQAQGLIDPAFMANLVGGGVQSGAGFTQYGGGGQPGFATNGGGILGQTTPGSLGGQGQQPFQKMQPGENMWDWRARERDYFQGGEDRNGMGQMAQQQRGGGGGGKV